MNDERYYVSPLPDRPGEAQPDARSRWKKLLMPLGVVGALLLKFKAFFVPALKFFPLLLKTGGTMLLSVGLYASEWGWRFAVGFVLLLLVHECGHLIAARRLGLKVGAPVFIPFMGAFIALKEAPRNAWIEAQVGIGGPLLGSLGAALCYVIFQSTGHALFAGLAYTGFFLNLFNLAPAGPLDGGRVVTALSPWLWVVGIVILGSMMIIHFNFLIILIFVMSLPRLFSLFRNKSAEERRYYEVLPWQRAVMGCCYFGLAALLVLGMKALIRE